MSETQAGYVIGVRLAVLSNRFEGVVRSMRNTTFELELRGRDALRVPQMHSSARPPRRG